MKEISKRIFLKYGTAEHRADMESQVSVEARNALIGKIEVLNLKHQKLNSRVRSFSAGLTVGTLGSSLSFGLFPRVESLFERIIGGGHHGVPAPGIEHGAPTHAPPVEGHTATPTPTQTPGLEHTPTPTPIPGHLPTPGIPTEAPPGVSPEAWHVFQSLPHDQQMRLTEIASDPAKLDAFNHWIAAHPTITPGVPEASALTEITTNPDLFHPTYIDQGTNLGKMLVGAGHEVTWNPTRDADELFSVITNPNNHQILEEARRRALEAGLANTPLPTVQQLVSDWIASKVPGEAGAAAFARGVDAAHWIPAGGELNIPTAEGIEAMKTLYGVR